MTIRKATLGMEIQQSGSEKSLSIQIDVKASIRTKMEHPFRVIKRQFEYVKVRNQGFSKKTAPFQTLFALNNLWMVRRMLLQNARGAHTLNGPRGRQ